MRRLPPLNALRAFEAAARHGSFQAAADELHVTPTAVSHQIRQLEAILGKLLFRRRPRPIRLTSAGQHLFPVLRDGFDRMAAAIADVQTADDPGPVTMTTTRAFASRWLIPRLAEVREACDGLELNVEASEATIDLHAGEVDFAVRYARAPAGDLVCHELFHDRYVPVCSPRLLESGPPLTRPADLGAYRLIHFQWKRTDPEAPTWERWLAVARQHDPLAAKLDPRAGLRFSEESHAIEAALEGQGVALMSDVILARELAAGVLVQPLETAIEGLAFFVMHLPETPYRDRIEAFVEWAQAQR